MFAAVVLAGGAALRLGGTSKPARTVGGIALLSRVLAALTDAVPVIVVGPPDLCLPGGVLRTVEQPPGGGPVAALAAGLTLLAPVPAAIRPGVDLVAVLAADLPFLTAEAVARVRTAAAEPGQDGAVLVDDAGRPQWLCGVWGIEALTRRLVEIGDPAGWGVRRLAAGLRVATVATVARQAPAWFDCDTEADIRRAEEWIDGQRR
jgi:molybdopterin-guanine dinucleotide biosynthesis protein A